MINKTGLGPVYQEPILQSDKSGSSAQVPSNNVAPGFEMVNPKISLPTSGRINNPFANPLDNQSIAGKMFSSNPTDFVFNGGLIALGFNVETSFV